MKKFSILLLSMALLSSSLLLTSCKSVRGDGNIKSQKRNLSDFKGVKVGGSMDVYLEIGSDYSVTVEADANILSYIATEVDGDRLRIGTENNVSLDPSQPIEIHVSAPSYDYISLAGSGNIYSKGHIDAGDKMTLNVLGSGNIEADVRAESVSADISGSGDITVKGSAKAINSNISGSGNLKAEDLEAEQGDINVAGSGNARVRVTSDLDVLIAGSGDVFYHGNPKVNSHVAGSGSVKRLD